MKTLALSVVLALPASLAIAAPVNLTNLSPAALDCYDQVMNNPEILPNTRQYRTTDTEKLAVRLCTYSNAIGAIQCFLDAKSDPEILSGTKQVTNIVGIEEKFVALCANARETAQSIKARDVDAIGCFKTMSSRKDLLPMLSQAGPVEFEKNLVQLCTTSNGQGAVQCLENAIANPQRVLQDSRLYKASREQDLAFIRLCRGSRVR